jgi:demethylmenaquinone methyltransferase/2-methoxy-6-polyprenyl-1,4-benzoquinol methylase
VVSPGGAADKHTAVRSMFGRIAGRYDLMNRLMSGGLDGLWRAETAAAAELGPAGLALDVGTGTGDLAFALADGAPGARVLGLDYTRPMLALAPGKARERALAGRTAWLQGDGQALPFPDDSFDAVASAFVLRNFADLGLAVAEMARVARPGGTVVALEISPDVHPAWRAAFGLYFGHVVPVLGRLVTGDDEAYRYLPASVAAFRSPAEVAELMRAAGLAPLSPRPLMLGTLVVHRGRKPEVGAPSEPAARTAPRTARP